MQPSIFKTCALFLDKGYYSKSIPVTMNDHNYYLSYCLRQTWSSLFVLINVLWARFLHNHLLHYSNSSWKIKKREKQEFAFGSMALF